jgi:hypothetical protein
MVVVYFSTFAWFCGEFHHTGRKPRKEKEKILRVGLKH